MIVPLLLFVWGCVAVAWVANRWLTRTPRYDRRYRRAMDALARTCALAHGPSPAAPAAPPAPAVAAGDPPPKADAAEAA